MLSFSGMLMAFEPSAQDGKQRKFSIALFIKGTEGNRWEAKLLDMEDKT